MRLQYPRQFPVFSWTCLRCGKQEMSDTRQPIADLDGPSFKAYYHDVCASIVEYDQVKDGGSEATWEAQQPIDTAHQ